jgi:prolyl oligopeptidase
MLRPTRVLLILFSGLLIASCAERNYQSDYKDPYLWLEEIEGPKALDWVKEQNSKTLGAITQNERFKRMQDDSLEILQAKDKIPYVSMMGDHLYNFWQDDKHVRGLWRRTTIASYKQKNPQWEVLIDLDQLAAKEKENWVYKGSNCLAPKYQRCLINLSRGGKDAKVVREFDVKTKSFVKNGFELPEAKSWVDWADQDSLFVATELGANSLTESGYPRIVKLWQRGQKLDGAKKIFEGNKKDMVSHAHRLDYSGGHLHMVSQVVSFFSSKNWLYQNGKLLEIPVPESAKILGFSNDHFIVELRQPWKVDKSQLEQGSLIAVSQRVVANKKVSAQDVQKIFTKDDKSSILVAAVVKDKILVNTLENVLGQVYSIQFKGGRFQPPQKMNLVSGGRHLQLASLSVDKNDFFYNVTDFINPDSLYYYDAKKSSGQLVKSLKPRFNNQGMVVRQQWAQSKDGTKVPYFLVGKKDVIQKGKAPTLLYGYGGFEVSLTPSYKPLVGKLWLEQGGLYVLANIRGGGEFGPQWHQAALQLNRQKAYDDFIAVAEDLIAKGTTNKDRLAIQGGSNGGLLVGAVMTQRPDLFKAVLCHVPLLDMLRYSQLLAGASWIAEYGDPRESKYRDFLSTISPYHNIKEGQSYPHLFLMTSTKDDRVHPGHARKMAAKMTSLGHSKLFYYENTEGGHAASANLKQQAKMRALSYEFLYKTIF